MAAGLSPSDPAGPTGRPAGWVHDVSWEDVPEEVRARAAHLVLDGIDQVLERPYGGFLAVY